MKTNYIKLIIVFSFLIVSFPVFSQYKIEMTIPNFPNSNLLFGHYFNESIMIQDTFFTNEKGYAVIQSEKNLPSGMYTVYLPNQSLPMSIESHEHADTSHLD